MAHVGKVDGDRITGSAAPFNLVRTGPRSRDLDYVDRHAAVDRFIGRIQEGVSRAANTPIYQREHRLPSWVQVRLADLYTPVKTQLSRKGWIACRVGANRGQQGQRCHDYERAKPPAEQTNPLLGLGKLRSEGAHLNWWRIAEDRVELSTRVARP